MEPTTGTAPDNPQRKRVDRILYLASLASRRDDIDPMMDTLREVTAHWQVGQPLAPQDDAALSQLEVSLKNYLVHQDPLRAFDAESLQQRLAAQEQPTVKRRTSPRSILAIIGMSLVAGGLVFALPMFELKTKAMLSVPLFFLALHIGIAWFYLTSLNNFNANIRRVFSYLSASVIILSLAFSHYVLINLVHLDQYPAFRYGGITWLFSIPFMLMFVSFFLYARILQVKSFLTSTWVPACIALGSCIVLAMLPHGSVPHESYFRFWSVGAAMIPVFALMSSVLARKIAHAVTEAYATSMKWLYYYTLVVGLGSIAAVGAVYWLGELYGGPLAIVTAVCGVTPQLVLLYTGYSFKKETSK
jgi:hypothetical protein